MGQEIEHSHFRKQDFAAFETRLAAETALLAQYEREGRLADAGPVAGFELEAWLVDAAGRPLPRNEQFLALAAHPFLSPELARFNVELNGTPQPLRGAALGTMLAELQATWGHCQQAAARMDAELVIAGILPTVRERDLVLGNISQMIRYKVLNEQVRRMRRGEPLELRIHGREDHVHLWQEDVMLESAATSFQLHLQTGPREAVRALNAAIILSGPMVAMSANSPYLFGHALWDESRIPVFEQAVSVCAERVCPPARVTFGRGYVEHSLLEFFEENHAQYPVLLPEKVHEDPARFSHLALHNGTIWRWNRPLVGFDEAGQPHLRIEHRVMAAGPTLLDAMANAAFFYGLMQRLRLAEMPPEKQLAFVLARSNFYDAARYGLKARVHWTDGKEGAVQDLLTDVLLPQAHRGLEELEVDAADRRQLLGIIEARLATGQNGAAWQRAWVARHGRDMAALTAAYRERSRTGAPVHEWTL